MDELEAIRRVAQRAAKEPPPRVDVVDGVLQEIAASRPNGDRALWAFAAVSAAAAVLVAAWAVGAWYELADPLQSLFAPAVRMME